MKSKYFFTTLLLIYSLTSSGQTKAIDKKSIDSAKLANFDFEKELENLLKASREFPIDSSNSWSFYLKAKSSIDSSDVNTNLQAVRILYELNKFDKHRYTYDLLLPVFKALEKKVINNHLKEIIGEWKSEPMVENWSGVVYNSNRQIKFTPTEVLYYSKDSVIRRTGYSINNSPGLTGATFIIHLTLQFSDAKDRWFFQLMKNGSQVPYHGKANEPYLYFNKQPGCLCGCPVEVYSRKKEEFIVNRK